MPQKFNFEAEPFEAYSGFDSETDFLQELEGTVPFLEFNEEAGPFDTERIDSEWLGEVNRNSRDYVRRVQNTLNKVLGLRLAVDGIMGPQTRSAIRDFQRKNGLTVDGVLGPRTQAVLANAAALAGAGRGARRDECTALASPVILDRFEYNRSRILPDHERKLNTIARCIIASFKTSSPITAVDVIGHTSPEGSDAYNLSLGMKRAAETARHLRASLDRVQPGTSAKVTVKPDTRGERDPRSPLPERNRRVEVLLPRRARPKPSTLTPEEQTEFDRLGPDGRKQFSELRETIEIYSGVAQREAVRGSRTLLRRGVFRSLPLLLPELLKLTKIASLPPGWSVATARPLLVGNILHNLSFPETINQGGYDRLGGKPDPTCFSASTQILLARRFPVTYVRLTIQLATIQRCTFAGGDSIGPLPFASTNLYRSLDSVLLQTAVDTYFRTKAMSGGNYAPGDELKVHRQVFGPARPPRRATYQTKEQRAKAFRSAFPEGGNGNVRPWEIVNLCTGDPALACGNHTVVLTRVSGGRVYFYNPWANEEEKNTMFGPAAVSIAGHGERPAESSMTRSDFENQLTAVFHN